jgi:hypothetical protein
MCQEQLSYWPNHILGQKENNFKFYIINEYKKNRTLAVLNFTSGWISVRKIKLLK